MSKSIAVIAIGGLQLSAGVALAFTGHDSSAFFSIAAGVVLVALGSLEPWEKP